MTAESDPTVEPLSKPSDTHEAGAASGSAPHTVGELQDRVARHQRRAAMVKLGIIAAMAVGVLLLLRFTALGDLLSQENLQLLLTAAGPWAKVVFVLVFAVLLALWVPGTVVTLAGAAIFGLWAIPLNYLGSVLGAALGFQMSRRIGGDALETLIGDRWAAGERYRHLMGERGFEATLYLRLIPTPYNAISYLAGLSPMSFRSYILGTAIGIIPGSITFTFLAETVVSAFTSGDLASLVSLKTLLAASLWGVALSIPYFVNQGRKRYGWFSSVDSPATPGS